MPRLPRCLIVFGMILSTSLFADSAPDPWPEITRETRPWTRWWWPGNAVDATGLTTQLKAFAAAGLGGVEITPIYGARGAEDRYIPYLTPAWMDALRHTGETARELGLGVDMATGTGWPFGGPWVDVSDGSHKLILDEAQLAGTPTAMMVKRAGPGGEGRVIDPYSPAALSRYLAPFSKAFVDFPRDLVRGQFHDSFEYYGAEWTGELSATFAALHGYSLNDYAAELLGEAPANPEMLGRLKSDYRATLSQLHLSYLETWRDWSHTRGWLVRNQSHGAPANLLDLYGAVDIPETETFGSTPFAIPGLRRDPADVRPADDLPEPLMMQMAASAAHVMGHPLISSETCTWLREHWKVALAYAKPEIDRLFVNGINHVFYHGTVYSPPDTPWPGWLFYASTQFNPNNPWWRDFGALNHYVTRVQSVLQRGRPDHDVLIYWPFFDVIDDPAGLMQQYGVHHVSWLTESPAGRLARQLQRSGIGTDFVSDAQLLASAPGPGNTLQTPGHRYRILLVPATDRMPVATLARLRDLATAGVKIRFVDSLPADVPGLGQLAERRAAFAELLASSAFAEPVPSSDIVPAIAALGIRQETFPRHGLEYIRRSTTTGHDYFVTNLSAQDVDAWITLGTAAAQVVVLDPLDDRFGLARLRRNAEGRAEVRLQLAAGRSLILRVSDHADPTTSYSAWLYVRPEATAVELTQPWEVTFLTGGPELPAGFSTPDLRPWTDQVSDPLTQAFSGTAVYRTTFELPAGFAPDGGWRLDLGDVRESARVRLNGHDLGTAWSVPFVLHVGDAIRPGRNELEIEVTNLAANRIREMDRQGITWRNMHEINFVNINYRPFDASSWPVTPSGLIGPVRLIPLHRLPES